MSWRGGDIVAFLHTTFFLLDSESFLLLLCRSMSDLVLQTMVFFFILLLIIVLLSDISILWYFEIGFGDSIPNNRCQSYDCMFELTK